MILDSDSDIDVSGARSARPAVPAISLDSDSDIDVSGARSARPAVPVISLLDSDSDIDVSGASSSLSRSVAYYRLQNRLEEDMEREVARQEVEELRTAVEDGKLECERRGITEAEVVWMAVAGEGTEAVREKVAGMVGRARRFYIGATQVGKLGRRWRGGEGMKHPHVVEWGADGRMTVVAVRKGKPDKEGRRQEGKDKPLETQLITYFKNIYPWPVCRNIAEDARGIPADCICYIYVCHC
jgi:hypothetical protein